VKPDGSVAGFTFVLAGDTHTATRTNQ